MTVVPSTNMTNLSLQYQSYLNDIFHTSWIARLGHALAMPCIVVCLSLIFYTYCGLWVTLAFHVGMTAWWMMWAAMERDWVWGIALAALSALVWSASMFLHAHQVSPWLPLLVFALIQTLSHLPEPLPPRVTRSARWVPLMDYLFKCSPIERLRRLGHAGMQVIYGCIDETLASPRLICVVVLELLWLCGHRREQRDRWKALSRKAIASGNPALDYIGIGGGTTLQTPTHAK